MTISFAIIDVNKEPTEEIVELFLRHDQMGGVDLVAKKGKVERVILWIDQNGFLGKGLNLEESLGFKLNTNGTIKEHKQ